MLRALERLPFFLRLSEELEPVALGQGPDLGKAVEAHRPSTVPLVPVPEQLAGEMSSRMQRSMNLPPEVGKTVRLAEWQGETCIDQVGRRKGEPFHRRHQGRQAASEPGGDSPGKEIRCSSLVVNGDDVPTTTEKLERVGPCAKPELDGCTRPSLCLPFPGQMVKSTKQKLPRGAICRPPVERPPPSTGKSPGGGRGHVGGRALLTLYGSGHARDTPSFFVSK